MKYWILLLLLVSVESLSAQILKVDKSSFLLDTSDYWYGNIDFKLNVNNRSATPEKNLTFIGLNGSANIGYASKAHTYVILNNLNYFTTGTGPFVSTGYAHFRVNWLRKKRLSYESFSQIQYDRGRRLQRRVLAGSGIRINFFQEKKTYLHAGIGAMYESELWQQSADQQIQINLLKSSNYIGAIFEFNQQVSLDFTCYYQVGYAPEFDQFLNRVSGDLNINLKINDRLFYTTSFRLQYESRPIIPINKVVYTLNNGLSFKLG